MLNSSDYAKNYASTIGKSLGWGGFSHLESTVEGLVIT